MRDCSLIRSVRSFDSMGRQIDSRAGSSRARRKAGVTLLELIVVMAVLTVAVTMFTSMVVHTTRQRGINRENAIASNAARTIIERMRNEDFREVFALYNPDPSDDPGGAGTAPGNLFAVIGLTPLAQDLDGFAGEIHLPVIATEEEKPPSTWGSTTLDLLSLGGGLLGGVVGELGGGSGGSGGSGGGGGLLGGLGLGGGSGGGGSGGAAGIHYPLREDCIDARLGLPRDLNGDSLVDDCDHSEDYIILPVRVEVSWRGRFGARSFSLYTQIAAFAKEEG